MGPDRPSRAAPLGAELGSRPPCRSGGTCLDAETLRPENPELRPDSVQPAVNVSAPRHIPPDLGGLAPCSSGSLIRGTTTSDDVPVTRCGRGVEAHPRLAGRPATSGSNSDRQRV